MPRRKGIGRGWWFESERHRLARMGIRTGRKVKTPVRKIKKKEQAEIGDGKLPNKYWVGYTNDFFICEGGECNWASDKLGFKAKGKTFKRAFDTYEEAIRFAEKLAQEIPARPEKDSINTITVDDRISGEVARIGVEAYKEDGLLKSYTFDFIRIEELDFTKEKMEEAGYKFK